MNCSELQRSLAESEGGANVEQQFHLQSCAACSALVTELNLIAAAAAELRGAEGPSPRVWNSLEIALRREGLIRPQRPARSLLPAAFASRWGWMRWLAPAAAALLITVGIYVRQETSHPNLAVEVRPQEVRPPVFDASIAGLNDADLLQEIADQSPVMRAEYENNLRLVNECIRDAEGDVRANPNDLEARRSLVEAYQQKAMLFEMAMDPAVP
jgi:hypothetical protein